MTRTLNVRFLAILLVGLVVSGAGVHFLHAYQVRRNAKALFDQAEQVLAKGLVRHPGVSVVWSTGSPVAVIVAPVLEKPDLVAASRFLSHYLALKPNDVDALVKYGLVLETRSHWGDDDAIRAAFFVFEKVVRLEPDQHNNIRRKLARMTLEAGHYQDALAHLEKLCGTFHADPELEQMRGRAYEATGKFKEAIDDFTNAKKHAPQQIDSYVSLASLLVRHFKNRADADKVMDELIENNRQSDRGYQAYLARARYWKEFKSPTKLEEDINNANDDIKTAYGLAPDNADVILAYAEMNCDQRKWDEAAKALEHGLNCNPDNVRLYQELARIDVLAQKPEKAMVWLQRGLKRLPQQQELLWALANLLIDEGKDADQERKRMEELGVPPAQLKYLQARVAINKEDWLDALQIMEQIRPRLADSPVLMKQVDLFMGQCYGQLGDLDQQYLAYRRALEPDPFWLPACLGMGSTLTAMGKIDEALEIYRRIIPQYRQAMLETARLLILRNLGLAQNERRWGEIDNLLEKANASFPVEVILLRADTLMAQGEDTLVAQEKMEQARKKMDQARNFLESERDRQPNEVRLWIALADLVERQGKSEEALAILDKAERQQGERQKSDRVSLLLARAQYWGRRGDDVLRAKKELTKLEKQSLATMAWAQSSQHTARAKRGSEDSARPTAPLRWKVLSALANAHLRLGDRWEAQRLLELLAKERPKELSVRLALFDIALEHGLEPAMSQLWKRIKKIEGREGTLWRYAKVRYLIWKAEMGITDEEQQDAKDLLEAKMEVVPDESTEDEERQDAKGPLEKAEDLLKTIAAHRPFWSRVPLGQALIEDARQKFADNDKRNYAQAIQYYLQAIKAGERSQATIRRAFELLCENRQYEEANQVLNNLVLTGRFQYLAAHVLSETNQFERAISLAQEAVNANKKDYRHHLWFAQLLWKAGDFKKVEKVEEELSRAKELAPSVPEVWAAWVLYLTKTGQTKKAETALEEAKAHIPAEHAPLALAQCYEWLGQFDQVAEQLRAALRAKPEAAATLRMAAASYLRIRDSKNAKAALQKLIDRQAQSPDDALWAKRNLAIVLAAEGDYHQAQEALKMLDGDDRTSEGLRAQALVLMAQKGRRRQHARKAIENLETIIAQPFPTPDDRFLLAQLYNIVGQWPKAREQMILLSDVFQDSGPFLAFFVKSLIDHREAAAAGPFLDRLERILAPGGTPELAEIKASFLAENGNPAAARDYLEKMVKSKPDQILLLVSFVGRQGRVTEALNLCREHNAWQRCPTDSVGNVCMRVLHDGSPNKEDLERVEEWLKAALAKEPKAATTLKVCLADLRDLQGRYREAEDLYRQALDKEPGNVVALNNLAWLLAFEEGQQAEALKRISQAIDIVGPMPALLDTQGMVYLANKNADKAVDVFEQAVEDEPTTAAYCFHLALAQQMCNDQRAVETALTKAKSLGISEEKLHALDRKLYQQLKQKYPALLAEGRSEARGFAEP